MSTPVLNIVGCGKVGRTLGSLFRSQGVFQVQHILNRSQDSADDAIKFIGEGRGVTQYGELASADVWMLTGPDLSLRDCAAAIRGTGTLRHGDLLFHCSGVLPSHILSEPGEQQQDDPQSKNSQEPSTRSVPRAPFGPIVASVHPVKSFAQPSDAVRTFAGTFCGIEACDFGRPVLRHAFQQIGGRVFDLQAKSKPLYHAASVTVCNHLVATLRAGLDLYSAAGLPRDLALALMRPLVEGTITNVFRDGCDENNDKFNLDNTIDNPDQRLARALTGPVARGDADTIRIHLKALSLLGAREHETTYRALAQHALCIARDGQTHKADAANTLGLQKAWRDIERMLK